MQYADTTWKQPVRPRSNGGASRRRVADVAASATTRLISDFAFAASGMYPELYWALIEQVNQPDVSHPERAPHRRSAEQGRARTASPEERPPSHTVFPPAQRRAIAGNRAHPGRVARLEVNPTDPPAPVVASAARARRSVPTWLAPTWLATLASLPARLWQRLRREREMWQNRAELQTLDDRTLTDIGLSRMEIEFMLGGDHRWRH